MSADITVRDNDVVTPTLTHKESSSKLTARQQTILELYTTEKNYVGILNTILQVCAIIIRCALLEQSLSVSL